MATKTRPLFDVEDASTSDDRAMWVRCRECDERTVIYDAVRYDDCIDWMNAHEDECLGDPADRIYPDEDPGGDPFAVFDRTPSEIAAGKESWARRIASNGGNR